MAVPGLALLAAGCAYDPPVRGDRASTKYQTDLAACRTGTAERVDKENAKRAPRWVVSPVTRPFQYRAGVRECMQGKGYAAEG